MAGSSSTSILDEVSNHDNGSTLIQELNARFECKRKKESSAAKRAYYSLNKEEMTIEELVHKIEVLGRTFTLCLDLEPLTEEDKIEQILLALPAEYSSVKRDIEKGDFDYFFEVVELIDAEEAIRAQSSRTRNYRDNARNVNNNLNSYLENLLINI